MKKSIILLLLLFPIQVIAYSNHLIVTGEPIGIEIHSNGVYIMDHYDQTNIHLKVGDQILEIDQKKVNSIKDMNQIILKEGTHKIKIKRKDQILNNKLIVNKKNQELKTGLYIKDEVNGIGTLSYIDPETKVFASLGHEVLESSSNTIFDIREGNLYEVIQKEREKNKDGRIGEIKANFTNHKIGTIYKNEINGIYGIYQGQIDNKDTIEVGTKEDVELGEAWILMNQEEQEVQYKIKILDLDRNNEVKNIYFKIIDNMLIEQTGGIIQGMSGTPILQNNKVIGVVNYVVVNNPTTGYGEWIENMLEEGDKLLES